MGLTTVFCTAVWGAAVGFTGGFAIFIPCLISSLLILRAPSFMMN